MCIRDRSIGGDYIATGHYAKVVRLENGRYTLKKAPSRKDQTYALYNLTQEQLSKTLMPDGDYTKEEIRQMAEDKMCIRDRSRRNGLRSGWRIRINSGRLPMTTGETGKNEIGRAHV